MIEMGVDLEGMIAAAMRRKHVAMEEAQREIRKQQRTKQLQCDAAAASLVCMALGLYVAEALAPVSGSLDDHAAHFAYHGVKFRLWKAADPNNPYRWGIALDVDDVDAPDYMQIATEADDILAYIGERVNPAYYRALSEGAGESEDTDNGR